MSNNAHTQQTRTATIMENLKFSVKDVIQFLIYAVTLVIFLQNMSNKIERLAENVATLQADKKDESANIKAFIGSFETRVNQNTQDIMLLKQQMQFQQSLKSKP